MGCGCLIALATMLSPRLALFLGWIFTDRLTIAFDHFIFGFVGFVLLPWTTLAYAVTYAPIAGVTGVGWVLVLVGLLFDLGSYGSGGKAQRDRASA